MESPKRRPGRPRTGRSLDSLAVEKLNRAVWCGSRSRVWITKRIHHAWKFLKGRSLFNTDSDFAAQANECSVFLEVQLVVISSVVYVSFCRSSVLRFRQV